MSQPRFDDEGIMHRVAPLLVLLAAAIAMVLVAVAVLGDLWSVLRSPQIRPGATRQVEAPALETAPKVELRAYLAEKESMAKAYSWIDPAHHLARIPVDKAMRALAASSTQSPREWEAWLMGAETGPGPKPEPEPQFRQNLGAALPLNGVFLDARGRATSLGDYFGNTPVVMVFGYYHCPRLCSTVMDGVLQGLENAGLPYSIVGVGIDPREKPRDAARKLAAYRAGDPDAGALHLLTGAEDQIAALARTAGFEYRYDKESGQYSHPAGFLVATPEGKISRYFPGLRFDRRDVRLALIEASHGRVGTLAERVTLLCSHYDPLAGRYTGSIMNIVRIFALLTVVLLAAGIWVARRWAKSRRTA